MLHILDLQQWQPKVLAPPLPFANNPGSTLPRKASQSWFGQKPLLPIATGNK